MTDHENLSDRLLQLAADNTNLSATEQLRRVFDTVDSVLAAGVSRKKILMTLAEGGIHMSMASFASARHRIKKERLQRPIAKPLTDRFGSGSTGFASLGNVAHNEASSLVEDTQKTESQGPDAIDRIASSVPDLDALARRQRKPA